MLDVFKAPASPSTFSLNTLSTLSSFSTLRRPLPDDLPPPPSFSGRPKKDGPVQIWLEHIEDACRLYKIPKELWHEVAMSFMKGRAKERWECVAVVMDNLYGGVGGSKSGGKYRWNWKKFKVAMLNMSWELHSNLTQAFRVASIPSGCWWTLGVGKNESEPSTSPPISTPSNPPFLMRRVSKPLLPHPKYQSTGSERPRPLRWRTSTASSSNTSSEGDGPAGVEMVDEEGMRKPGPSISRMDNWQQSILPSISIVHAPIWLLHVCHSLDDLSTSSRSSSSRKPHSQPQPRKQMSVLSAILVTLNEIPHVPISRIRTITSMASLNSSSDASSITSSVLMSSSSSMVSSDTSSLASSRLSRTGSSTFASLDAMSIMSMARSEVTLATSISSSDAIEKKAMEDIEEEMKEDEEMDETMVEEEGQEIEIQDVDEGFGETEQYADDEEDSEGEGGANETLVVSAPDDWTTVEAPKDDEWRDPGPRFPGFLDLDLD
ncbi:hypothetical protein ABKN59_010038 [Abortiporus biennis]